MARDINAKCKKCRRAGEKLFLKGDRCQTAKCAMVRKAYIPGVHGKTIKKRALSEYGLQLQAKQKMKRIYGILEKQFRKHFEEVKEKKGIAGDLFIARLEMRLDNVVYRMGLADSRALARQLVNHGMITVNGKKVSIPSYETKIGQAVSVKSNKAENKYFKRLEQVVKNKKDFPSWLRVDLSKFSGEVIAFPQRKEIGINVDTQMIVEYYSR